ncbi:ABC transporter ATP-binding protein [Clostridiaceae bacterium M8S5]|nr:ABC transporter ATP-binding protein [Clostridiaceae bacterium M8S5]
MKKKRIDKAYFISLLEISKAPFHMYIVMIISLLYVAGFNVLLSYLIHLGLNSVVYEMGEVSLLKISILLCVGCLLYIIASYLLPIYKEKIFQYLVARLKKKLYTNIINLSLAESQKMNNGDYLTRMIEDCDNCCRYITRTIFSAIQLGVNIILGVIYVCYFSLNISLVLLIVMPIFYILNKKFSNKIAVTYSKFQESEGKHRSLFEEIHENGSIIKIYNLEKRILNKEKNIYTEKYRHAKEQASSISNMATFTETGVLIIELLILVIGIYLVRADLIVLGTLIGIWNASIGSIVYPITELPYILADVAEQYASWERVSKLIKIKDVELINKTKIKSIDLVLKLKDVAFGYSGKKELFSEINMSCDIGEIIYLIGESGIGKSTLIKLILNLYQPTKGDIYIKAKDRKITKEELKQYISYVPQDNAIFALSVYDNITLGLDNISIEQVEEVAKLSKIHEFIKKLPNGYSTVIKDDINISAGQAQRIAIARAIIRDTPFIIMDEPFSALDNQNIKELKKMLITLSKTKGCIIVSHESASIQSKNKIVKISGGGSVEEVL